MTFAPSIQPVSRRDPTVRRIARLWRDLTGGLDRGGDSRRRTLVACSGGADSSGLLVALAAAVSKPEALFVVAHVVHDLRSVAESLADRDAVRNLATGLGLGFAEARIRARPDGGNIEGSARRLRYAALKRLAAEHGCGFIATAHQADDQLETVIMKLLRGAGPRGLAGVASLRTLGKDGPTVIRPALTTNRRDLERVCRAAGWEWCEDLTNSDTTRLRAAIRVRVLPHLRSIRPRAAERASKSAALLADAVVLVDKAVRALLIAGRDGAGASGEHVWERSALSLETGLVLGALLQTAASEYSEHTSCDRLGSKVLDPIVAAIRAESNAPRRFTLGPAHVEITKQFVRMCGACRE